MATNLILKDNTSFSPSFSHFTWNFIDVMKTKDTKNTEIYIYIYIYDVNYYLLFYGFDESLYEFTHLRILKCLVHKKYITRKLSNPLRANDYRTLVFRGK